LLVKIRYLQGILLGRMQNLGFDLTTESTLIFLTLDVVDSSKIEGEFLNPELVRSSIANKLGIENTEFTFRPLANTSPPSFAKWLLSVAEVWLLCFDYAWLLSEAEIQQPSEAEVPPR
jgi:hypothetical protein